MQVFVEKPRRVEAAIIAVYDSCSVLNKGPEAIAMREVISQQGVVILESQGPAALLLNLVCASLTLCLSVPSSVCKVWTCVALAN
jgi:hypothetical protein